jgi:hypothetical protein
LETQSSAISYPPHILEVGNDDSCGGMTHLKLVGAEHGPPSEEVVHHGRHQDLVTEGGQPGTPPVFVDSDGARFGVEALVRVYFEHELAVDGRNRR